MITKKNLVNHELIGLNVETGKMKGLIVDETKNTFIILKDDKEKIIPKQGSVFLFRIKDEKVLLKGDDVLQRPYERLKKSYKVKDKWQEMLE
ncbi:MAG: ribonuclease P protein subunit [Nanoarchaeota archaeon]|nr:ribonuclease P protein subunit [Nanoarchaeota archaeon]